MNNQSALPVASASFLSSKPVQRIAVILLALGIGFLSQRAGAQLIVIANPDVKATDISKSDLRDVLTGASSSLKGASHVTPVLLKQGSAHEEMLSLYVQKSDAAFRASWRSLLFSGQAALPKTLDSEAALVDFVAHTPGAIGYIARSTPHENVRTLAVR